MSTIRIICASALAVAIAATPRLAGADHPDRIKVGVVSSIAVSLDASRVDSLSQDMVDALVQELDIDAVGGLEVRRQLPPDGLPSDCVAVPACVTDVAKRLGANQLLFVVMVDTGAGGAIQIDSTWVDPASGRSVSRPPVAVAAISEAKARFAAAARRLLPDAPIRTKAVTTTGPRGALAPAVPRHLELTAKITAGGAVVGLGAGIAFGLVTRSHYHRCENDVGACTTGDRDSIRATALVADISFVVATGCAIATGILFATSGREAHLIVAPSADGAAITAVGRF